MERPRTDSVSSQYGSEPQLAHSRPQPAKSRSIQMLGAGLELAATVGISIGAGSLLDQTLNLDKPVFAAVFALFGFGLAMVRFIIRANRMTEQSSRFSADDDRTSDKIN
jgi:F0F1-type ATP synthase assembly protein I